MTPMWRNRLLHNWPLKLVALGMAMITWWSVHRMLPPHLQ